VAQVKIEEVVEHFRSEMRRAHVDAVREVLPSAAIGDHALLRAFVRAVGRKCNTWENVPDHYIQS
jgi:hypothetical protein